MKTSYFTPEIWATIIEKTEEGEHLRGICREIGIGKSAVYEWMEDDAVLKKQYATARAEGYDVIAQRIRNTTRGKTAEEDGDSTGDVQRDKLIAEYDLKLLARWYPKKYGDRIAHVGGDEDDAPIRTETKLDFGDLTEEQLRALASIRVPT